MKIVLLIGNKSNQKALAVKVKNQFELSGVVIENKKENKSLSGKSFVTKAIDWILFFKIILSWKWMQKYYKNAYPTLSGVQTLIIDNINSKEVLDYINNLKPDLLMVSGTSLIKKDILSLKFPKGIVNLHTGLAPYIKGGPNCTNWCIANNTIHLIGNTVMWIDKGIDSGNIITSATVKFTGHENLNQIHLKVMEQAHELYIDALKVIQNDYENCPSVRQSDIGEGKLFLSKMWDYQAKSRFMYNLINKKFKKAIQGPTYSLLQQQLKLIKLPTIKK